MTCKQVVGSTECMFPVNGMLLKSQTCPAGRGGCVAQETLKSPFLMTQDRGSKWQAGESDFVYINKEEECWVLINTYEASQKLTAKLVSVCFKICFIIHWLLGGHRQDMMWRKRQDVDPSVTFILVVQRDFLFWLLKNEGLIFFS